MKGLVLTFPNNDTLNVDYITSSLVINENYFKSLKSVDNNCKLKVIFTTTLSNKLKLFADDDITASVYNTDEELVFRGFLRKTFTFNKTQKNEPIDIEVVSPSYLLNKELTREVFKTSETVGNIINALGSQLGLNLGCTISNTVDYFRAVKGDNVKSVIEQLLFEHEYTFDFTKEGAFITYPLFNQPTTTNIVHAFTGSDCLEKIQIKRTEKQYTGVTASWQKKEYVSETLLYEDTQGATTSASCSIDIPPRSYMYGENNDNGRNYLQFDSTKGEVLYASNIWLVANGTYTEMLNTSYENCGDSVLWSAFNPHMTITATYHKFQWWGRAWVATSTNESKTTVTGDKSLELSLSYLNDGTEIAGFIAKVADYYRYSLFSVTIKSKEDVSVGSFVTVQDYGTGKITGRVLTKQTNYTGVYTYTIESISEYTPASLDEEKNKIIRNPSDGNSDNIVQIKEITDSLQEQIDGIETGGTTCALDLNSIMIEIDDQGYTQTVQTFTIFVSLKRSEKDIPFVIGNNDNPFVVPQGWTYVVDGKKITFTVGEGVQVTADSIKIPVIYRPILSETPFVDENGNAFVDENVHAFCDVIYGASGTVWNLYLSYIGNGYGKFLGTFTTLQQINTCNPNVSDYFVWGGTNRLETDLTYEGYLRQAQTYKYIGTGKTWSWQEDTNSGHMQAALSDVLAIADADLEHNNSTVWEYLDHLTANSVYCDKLVANDAFINKLAAKIITADLITTSKLEEELQSYETKNGLTEELKKYVESNKLFADGSSTLKDGTLDLDSIKNIVIRDGKTLIAGGYINTNVLDVETINAGLVKTTYLESNYTKTENIDANFIKGINGVFDNIAITGFANFTGGVGVSHGARHIVDVIDQIALTVITRRNTKNVPKYVASTIMTNGYFEFTCNNVTSQLISVKVMITNIQLTTWTDTMYSFYIDGVSINGYGFFRMLIKYHTDDYNNRIEYPLTFELGSYDLYTHTINWQYAMIVI